MRAGFLVSSYSVHGHKPSATTVTAGLSAGVAELVYLPAGRQAQRTEMFYVYVLRSLRDGGFYIGLTSNLRRRLAQHNAGEAHATRSRRPFELLLSETLPSRQAARSREKYCKSGVGREFLGSCFPQG
jgi:putative endonuclease